jgi:hypothetical protein
VLKSAFSSKLLAGIVAASLAFAGTPVIGIITASGHFTVERSEVWGNSTLFDGTMVETKSASSELALRNGVKLQLAASSRARVWANRLSLEKGIGQVAATDSYPIEAGGLTVRGSESSRMRVGVSDRVEVASLSGTARVVTGKGLLLAAIPAGRSMSFSMQAAESGVMTRSGCLVYKDGHFLLQDENTQEVAEVTGPDLAQNVGSRVEVTGTASSAKPAVSIATISITATSVAQKSQGGCLSVAAALSGQTEVPGPGMGTGKAVAVGAATGAAAGAAVGAAAGSAAGLSTGAIVGIVAAGGGAAAAAGVLAMSKKGSTSP